MNHSDDVVVDGDRCAGFMLLMKSLMCLLMGTSSRLIGVELPRNTTDEN